MIVLVTGSKKWADKNVVWEVLDEVYDDAIDRQCDMKSYEIEMYPREVGITMINGEAHSGADWFAEEWAKQARSEGKAVDYHGFPADWENHSYLCPPKYSEGYKKHIRYKNGKPYCPAAGIRRNIEMVEFGELEVYNRRYAFQPICLAWCLDDSPGTIHCARLAKRRGYDLRPYRQGIANKRL